MTNLPTRKIQNEWKLDELNSIIDEAKSISEKYSGLSLKNKVDVKQIFQAMFEMHNSMLDLMTKFKSAVELKNKYIICKFNDQLKESTSFMSNEMNFVRKEIDTIKNDDEIECVKTVQSCSRDLKRVWIRFASAKEATEIRNANSYAAIEGLLAQMNIKLNMSQYPLETFFFQNRRFARDQTIPEIALCCVFASSALAKYVKGGITKYNRRLAENKQIHLIKNTISTDWSYDIRKILKPCIEMKRFEIVDGVLVTNDGIKVYHKEIENGERQTKSTFVNSMNKLDILRRNLNDFNFTVPAEATYNKEYFRKSFDERKSIRKKYYENSGDGDVEYEISEDDSLDV